MAESKETFFAALMDQYAHQNELLWSRVQTLSAIQAAVIAGSFAVPKEPSVYYVGVLLLGIILTFLVLPVIWRDIKVRECNRGIIEKLGKEFDKDFVLNPEPPQYFPVRGDHIILVAVVLLLLVDFALLFWIPIPK